MSCKSTVQEWRHAMDVLILSAADFSGMKDEILPILKYSYDSVNGEVVKSCFLYCSLFPEDYLIDKERLVDYWICEGFIDESQGRERAINQELQLLEYLENLTIEVRSGFVLDQLLSSPMLVKCIRKVDINSIGESTKVLTLLATSDLRRLNLTGCTMGEIQIERTTPCFQSLSQVDICVCYRLKDLMWLVFAPNLVDLRVKYSNQLEEIISKINISECPMLRKFPLDSNSVVRFEVFFIEYAEEGWIKEVEWEDEATQLRFLPFCKLSPDPTISPDKSNTHTQSINSVEG
uniref:Disease resistance protein winged helix domain-containing protein n=1 Tax=Brassica oleracea var. oleracea TaxID=109376 RepID=A0A0D3DRT2_BRAOL